MSTKIDATRRSALAPGSTNRQRVVAVGRRIADLRRRRGWSLGELAQELGVSRERLGSWERGRYLPAFDGLLALRNVLGVSIDELLTGEPAAAGLSRGRQDEAREHLAALTEILGRTGEAD